MKPNTFYLFVISTFALLSSVFAYGYSSDDDDGDNFKIITNGDLNDGFETDNEMKEFNKNLDTTVDIINKRFEQEIVPQLEKLQKEAAENAIRPEHLKDEKYDAMWNEIVANKVAKLREKLYKDLSYSYFKDLGKFITKEQSEEGDTMTSIGGKNIIQKGAFDVKKLVAEIATDAGGAIPGKPDIIQPTKREERSAKRKAYRETHAEELKQLKAEKEAAKKAAYEAMSPEEKKAVEEKKAAKAARKAAARAAKEKKAARAAEEAAKEAAANNNNN